MKKKPHHLMGTFTGDRTRTGMELPPIDFESIVSTNFTTPAGKLITVV